MKKPSITKYFFKTASESINNALELHIQVRKPLDKLSSSLKASEEVFKEHVRQGLIADYTKPVYYKVTVERVEENE